jgi:hypothetical protein
MMIRINASLVILIVFNAKAQLGRNAQNVQKDLFCLRLSPAIAKPAQALATNVSEAQQPV